MAWALLDDNFPNHPKATDAGRLAAYLFVCGLCYCRKYQTDGFISRTGLKSLWGSPSPSTGTIQALIRVHLWEVVDGGDPVHGYQQMYADADAKAKQDEKREVRRTAGREGGLAKARNAASKASKPLAHVPSKPLPQGNGEDRIGSVDLHVGEKCEEGAPPPLDRWLCQLQEDYPQQRATFGFMTSSAFFETFQKDPRPADAVWMEMRVNLENQKSGYEWRMKGMVPKLEKWLRDGLWKQRHDPDPPASDQLSPRTNRTLTAAANILKERT